MAQEGNSTTPLTRLGHRTAVRTQKTPRNSEPYHERNGALTRQRFNQEIIGGLLRRGYGCHDQVLVARCAASLAYQGLGGFSPLF